MADLRGQTVWRSLLETLLRWIGAPTCRECGRVVASEIDATQEKWSRSAIGGQVRWVCNGCRKVRSWIDRARRDGV